MNIIISIFRLTFLNLLINKFQNFIPRIESVVYKSCFVIFFILLCLAINQIFFQEHNVYGQHDITSNNKFDAFLSNITLSDPLLRVEQVAYGFHFPTGMAFIGPKDILLIEKEKAIIYRITDGKISYIYPLDISSSAIYGEGLLGITVDKNTDLQYQNQNIFNIFLYINECGQIKLDCKNVVYKYKFDKEKNTLNKQQILIKLPGLPGDSHNGGKLTIGPDDNLYITIGDLIPTKLNKNAQNYKTKTQNVIEGIPSDGRAGILRVTQDGKIVENRIFVNNNNEILKKYYAYGIRNSFGMDFDPITKNLWITENGPEFGDEINLAKNGFNSGWEQIQGIWSLDEDKKKIGIANSSINNNLVDFNGIGIYSDPEFVWNEPVAPTALVFFDSNKFGKKYENDIFVGSVNNGNIFHFDLNKNRSSFVLEGSLSDKIADSQDENKNILFAEGLGVITDLKVDPFDGDLYIVSKTVNGGALFKILP